jgi:hypothetical protein
MAFYELTSVCLIFSLHFIHTPDFQSYYTNISTSITGYFTTDNYVLFRTVNHNLTPRIGQKKAPYRRFFLTYRTIRGPKEPKFTRIIKYNLYSQNWNF